MHVDQPEPDQPPAAPAAVLGEHREAVAADLERLRAVATRAGVSLVAAECERELQRLHHPAAATVVVVGEINKGKSSLVNALVGTPDLLPVDVDVATGSYIRLHHGAEHVARVFSEQDPGGVAVDVAALADWVCARQEGEGGGSVRFAEVALPSELLAHGVDLVDTPGLGGLTRMHAELTMSVVAQADALLYVCDALSPLAESDVELLEEAVRTVPVVRLVLNKVDVAAGLDQLLEDDRRVLATHLPQLAAAPVSTTSARLALTRLRRDGALDPATDRSGVCALRRVVLEDVVQAVDRARVVAADRFVTGAARTVATALERAVAAGDDVDESRRQLAEVQPELQRLRVLETTWQADLRRGVELACRAASNAVQDAAADLRRELDRDIDVGWKRGRLRSFADEVQVRLTRANRELGEATRAQLLELWGRTAGDLAVDDVELAVAAAQLDTPLPAASLTSAGLDRTVRSRLARQLLMSPTGARGSATLLGAGFGFVVGGPIGPVIAAVSIGFALFDVHAATLAAEQREAHRHLAEVLGRWQRDLRQLLEDECWQTLGLMQPRLEEALRRHVEDLDGRAAQLLQVVDGGHLVDERTLAAVRTAAADVRAVESRAVGRADGGAPGLVAVG